MISLILIISMDGFFGPIHGLIQIDHYRLVYINPLKNLFQRFPDGTSLLHSSLNLTWYDTNLHMASPSSLRINDKACHSSKRNIIFTSHIKFKRDQRDIKLVGKCVIAGGTNSLL